TARPFDIGARSRSRFQIFIALDAKGADHLAKARAAHDHEGAAVFPANEKIWRKRSIRHRRNRRTLTRQRHRARVAICDLTSVTDLHQAMLESDRTGDVRLPSPDERILRIRWYRLGLMAGTNARDEYHRKSEPRDRSSCFLDLHAPASLT